METNATVTALSVGTTPAPPSATLPPSVVVPATTTTPTVTVLPDYAKPFLDISRIKVFFGQNCKRWQERIYFTLDMHGVARLLSIENTLPNSKARTHANNVCRHTILTTLSNELFDVYCA